VSEKGHGPALLSMEANGRCGSTAVHPVSCENRPQRVMGWTPPDGIYVPR